MRLNRRRPVAAALVMIVLAWCAPGLAAGATPAGGRVAAPAGSPALARDVAAGTGYDISNYQCGQTLPAAPEFAVVEVAGAPFNRTTPASCLQAQVAYAATASVPAQFYVYAASTANRRGSYPVTTACGSAPTAQCVHDYASGAAVDALSTLDAAGLPATPATWWVDVECATASCADWHISDGRTDLNQAAVLGYVDGLRSRPDRVAGVGFYSTAYQWGRITGQTAGVPAFGVEGLPVWYASAASDVTAGAAQYCGTTGFTGGPIALVQGAPVPSVPGGPDDVDPDASCQPMIATVTQGAAAGGVVTATGISRPASQLTLLLSDSFTPQRPFAVVPTDAAGRWTLAFHLGSNGVLTAQDDTGASQSVAISVVARIAVTRVRAYGRDRIGHCLDRVDGSTYPYVPGSRAYLRGPRDRAVGSGRVAPAGVNGAWSATLIVVCGKAGASTKASISGLLPGSLTRYATDGKTNAVKLPVNVSRRPIPKR